MEQVLEDELLLEEAAFTGMRRLQSTPARLDKVGYIVHRAFVRAAASKSILDSSLG